VKLIRHKGGGWVFFVPAKLTASGKRKSVYRTNYNAAYAEMMRYKRALREHGKAAISDEERGYISLARAELGDLKLLPDVIRFWFTNGPGAVTNTALPDAVTEYLEFRSTLGLDRRTLRDTRGMMRQFSMTFVGRFLHEVTSAELRSYIDEPSAPATKKTRFKHQRLFWAWAKQERLITTNPLDSIRPPVVRAQEAQVYKVGDFAALLHTADAQYPDLVPFLGLSGFGMMRSGELLSLYADKPVLTWENVIWERGLVAVPERVAKQTRRTAGNRREFPLCDALLHWLEPYRNRNGRIVTLHESVFRQRMSALFSAAGVAKIPNGLRKSAISYYIARNAEFGVTLAARFAGNSEAISRMHYLAWLSQEAGEAYFAIRRDS
jgi:hypothetical protein